jgi:hypothetical protein
MLAPYIQDLTAASTVQSTTIQIFNGKTLVYSVTFYGSLTYKII